MPSHSISLGPHGFAKKLDAAIFLRAMLNRYDVGDKVSAADAEVLRAALSRHPDVARKVGCGVAGFSVRSADFGSKCFWVNRVDGTTEKFSIAACVYDKR